jgi:putative heme-binding domain-containing protein
MAAVIGGLLSSCLKSASAQDLQDRLIAEGAAALAKAVQDEGDPQRGAILFHQAYLACAKCHDYSDDDRQTTTAARLGPDLTKLDRTTTVEALIESIMHPSKTISKGFDSVLVELADGRSVVGLVESESEAKLEMRNATDGARISLSKDAIETRQFSPISAMPPGLVNQLTSRQQFLDLVRYLVEVRDGGPQRASELKPPPSLIALQLPDYESRIDHQAMIHTLDGKAFDRGRAIYERLCVNCHGTHEQPGSLPTSLRFASGAFKNGSDPFSMYQTLTRGFGMMAPQVWMVPQQKYDVVHYIREAYLREHNPAQYFTVTDSYLNRLPKGDTRGPAPRKIEPWITMDYGPSLINTYEIGRDGTNFAYKGIAVRLDPGPGGISRGKAWMIFDHDTLRMAAAWTGTGFIDWNGIHFNGRHQIHPRIVGEVLASNPTGPGWANPETGKFEDDARVVGRDGRQYGPLPRTWGRYHGLYHHGDQVIVAYSVGSVEILESPAVQFISTDSAVTPRAVTAASERARAKDIPVFSRSFEIGPRDRELLFLVATQHDQGASLERLEGAVRFGPVSVGENQASRAGGPTPILAGLVGEADGCTWKTLGNRLCLRIPAGEKRLRFNVWFTHEANPSVLETLRSQLTVSKLASNFDSRLQGGPPRWPQKLTTEAVLGETDEPFAVDVLTHPLNNPWLAQMRFTGLDFYPDGDRAVVCAWDGDVWLVCGLSQLSASGVNQPAANPKLTWQRIASGLFQPLVIKLVE